MKVVNRLDGAEVEIEGILAVYTGPQPDLSERVPQAPDIFEASVPSRILPHDLVLHELNLLQVGFTFWIKIGASSGEDNNIWVPARIDP